MKRSLRDRYLSYDANLVALVDRQSSYLHRTVAVRETLVSLEKYILMVFSTKHSCYQYSIITPNSYVFQRDDIFLSADSATKEGRLVIQFASY